MPELGTPGSVRGVLSNGHSYRDLADATEPDLAAGAGLFGHQAKISRQLAPGLEGVRVANGGDHGRGGKHADAGNGQNRFASPILPTPGINALIQASYLLIEPFDALQLFAHELEQQGRQVLFEFVHSLHDFLQASS
ncbi:hypothetical protein D3C87_1726270 [compost metagenome]